MPFLREHVGTISSNSDRDTTFAKLLEALQSLSLEVDKADLKKARITVRCLTQAANLIFWRCWNDRLLFDIRATSNGNAVVNAYVVPNLFMVSVPKGGNMHDAGRIVMALTEALRH